VYSRRIHFISTYCYLAVHCNFKLVHNSISVLNSQLEISRKKEERFPVSYHVLLSPYILHSFSHFLHLFSLFFAFSLFSLFSLPIVAGITAVRSMNCTITKTKFKHVICDMHCVMRIIITVLLSRSHRQHYLCHSIVLLFLQNTYFQSFSTFIISVNS